MSFPITRNEYSFMDSTSFFYADSEYVFCFMIRTYFCGENYEICVKFQEFLWQIA
jgi:hypothetical protein